MLRLNVQVAAYGYRRQTVLYWGVVGSCDPLQNFEAPINHSLCDRQFNYEDAYTRVV